MAANGTVTADLVLSPVQRGFDLLIALFDPHPQAIQTHHLG